jgi:putative zinc ribbon protein
VSDSYDQLREQGRARARATAVWDPRFCPREWWESHMAKIPHDAIGADLTKLVDWRSYGDPQFWYVDERFQCKDCGLYQVWKAASQQWWYEVARGSLYSKARRCRACRKALRETGKVSHAERSKRVQSTRQD